MQQFSLSANIEEGLGNEFKYIVTPNARDVAAELVNGYHSGIHSFTVIGSYGTGKSSFLLALERDLLGEDSYKLLNPKALSANSKFEILKFAGDYKDLASLMCDKL